MKSNKIKLLFLINTVTEYTNNFYSELFKKYNIRVLVLNRNYKNYNFSITGKYYNFLDKKKNKKKELENSIKRFCPTHIIFGGYRLKFTQYIKTVGTFIS